MADEDFSIVEYFAEHEGYRCGYCKSLNTNYSHGMWGHSLKVQDYQDLINRGWRRSGFYCYKPTMNLTCCPQYTIRCDAPEFQCSKSQKSILKRMHKYLSFGNVPQKASSSAVSNDRTMETDFGQETVVSEVQQRAAAVEKKLSLKEIPGDLHHSDLRFDQDKVSSPESMLSEASKQRAQKDDIDDTCDSNASSNQEVKKMPKTGVGPDPAKPQCKKAKLMRIERKLSKARKCSAETNVTAHVSSIKPKECPERKSIEDHLLEPISEHPAHVLQVRLVRSNPPSSEFQETFLESYRVYRKYQMVIHKESESETDKDSYYNFLVKSPLQPVCLSDGPECGYGSFHQQYWLDGKLIAVGVVDILPQCVSSVYFYYDPDYGFLSLGTYASLREIAFVRELQRQAPDLRYYYMGFYIQACPKMRYKSQYFPSYLLCPEVYTWHAIEKCKAKLDASKYSRLEEQEYHDKTGEGVELRDVLVLHRHEAMPYSIYRTVKPSASDEAEVSQYASLVGMSCTTRMLLFRSNI